MVKKTFTRISDDLHYIIIGMRETMNITYLEATAMLAEILLSSADTRFLKFYEIGKEYVNSPFKNILEETRFDKIVKLKNE